MLLAADVAAGLVLQAVQAGTLLCRHRAVGLGRSLHAVDALLLGFQAPCFAARQLTAGLTLLDALVLSGLARVNARRGGRGGLVRGLRQRGGRKQGKNGEGGAWRSVNAMFEDKEKKYIKELADKDKLIEELMKKLNEKK